MADASCPRDINITPVTRILDANGEGDVASNIKKGMTLRSGRVLEEPSAKRMRGGKKYKHRGGGAKELVLNGLASILAASTLAGAGVSAWCYVGPSVNAFIIGCYTNDLLPKCATTTNTLMGWDTGINFKRALSTAYSYISKKDECKDIDWQHNLANDLINYKLAQIIAIVGAAGLSSYSPLKSFWLIILNACFNATSKSVGVVSSSLGAVSSYVTNLFSSKKAPEAEAAVAAEPIKLDPMVVNEEILVKIHDEIDANKDAEVVKLLTLVATELDAEELDAKKMDTSTPPKAREKTPDASELVPNSSPASREATPSMMGGRKNRRTMKRRSKRSNSNKRSTNKRSTNKRSNSNKRSKSKRRRTRRS